MSKLRKATEKASSRRFPTLVFSKPTNLTTLCCCRNGGVVKYYTTFTNTIFDVLASRGWQEVEADEDVCMTCSKSCLVLISF
jgi:hypothetical protein